MRNNIAILLFAFLCLSCSPSVQLEDLKNLNGYWQIEKVEMPDGSIKSYGMNTVYDHIQYKDKKGTRIKVMPKLDGHFETNEVQENFTVESVEEEVILRYLMGENKWDESIQALSDQELVVKNSEGIIYHYKRAEPINLMKSDEENKQ